MLSLDFRFASADLKAGELNALVKKVGGVEKVRQVLRGELKLTTSPAAASTVARAKSSVSRRVLAGLLEEVVEPVHLPAIPRFVAREKFVVDRNGELPISGLGSNFETNFLDVEETGVPAIVLKQRRLRQRSVDTSILAALGDTDLAKIEKARIALAHVFGYLKTANCGLWYIFYVADAKGRVWAVHAYWYGGGWYVEAFSVSDPNEWFTDLHVVSR